MNVCIGDFKKSDIMKRMLKTFKPYVLFVEVFAAAVWVAYFSII